MWVAQSASVIASWHVDRHAGTSGGTIGPSPAPTGAGWNPQPTNIVTTRARTMTRITLLEHERVRERDLAAGVRAIAESLLRKIRLDLNEQLVELLLRHRRRAVRHQIGALLRLRERDHVAHE